MAQIRHQKERKSKNSKARGTLLSVVSAEIFTRIMAKKSAFEIWNFLKTEYEGDGRIKGMQVMNLVREFEMQKMNGSETIKEYTCKLLSVVNKIRLVGSIFSILEYYKKYLLLFPRGLMQLFHHWRIVKICQQSHLQR